MWPLPPSPAAIRTHGAQRRQSLNQFKILCERRLLVKVGMSRKRLNKGVFGARATRSRWPSLASVVSAKVWKKVRREGWAVPYVGVRKEGSKYRAGSGAEGVRPFKNAST